MMAHKLVGPKRSRAQLDEPFTDGSHDRPEALSHGLLNGLLTKIKKKKSMPQYKYDTWKSLWTVLSE